MSVMKMFTVPLPDPIARLIECEAATRGVDTTALCASVLVENFLPKDITKPEVSGPLERQEVQQQDGFRVGQYFRGLPQRSIDFAQAIVDEALKLTGVRAFRSNRGVGFEPNFVFIEYLRERTPGGIGLSLYGGPDHHNNNLIRDGRTASYSRALIRTPAELSLVIPHVRKAFALKFGK
jgi:hypothetical protein